MLIQRVSVTALIVMLLMSTARGQGPGVASEQAAPFMGTWVFTMTDPAHFKGTQQVVRLSDENGRIVASLQVGKFPPSDVTGIYRDGDMLVLTIGLHAKRPIMENGAALRTVIALTREGDEMRMAQMFGEGPTVKRGIARKQ
jgi:hypothetical protein